MTPRLDHDLIRLRDLRLKREERALEKVAQAQDAVRKAENVVSDTKNALNTHIKRAQMREREITAGIIGRTLRQQALARMRLEFDVFAQKQSELRKLLDLARMVLQTRENDLDNARQIYKKFRLETEKLRLLLEQRKTKSDRRQVAVTEAMDEDQFALKRRDRREIST
jgi:hypothetical protein